MSILNTLPPAFGLDIGDISLKAVQLVKKKGSVCLQGYNEVKLPSGLIEGGEIKQPQKIADYIRILTEEAKPKKIKTPYVVSVLPEPKTFIKACRIPNVPAEKIPETVLKSITTQFPFSLDKTYWDWKILQSSKDELAVLVGAVEKNISDSYFNLLKLAGLIPVSLSIEALAITQSLIGVKEKSTLATFIIDIGATRTSLIIYDHQTVQCSLSLKFSGDRLTRRIADNLGIYLEAAEQEKINYGLKKDKIKEVLDSLLNELLCEIQEFAHFYIKDHFPQPQTTGKIILCGGGSGLRGLEEFLSQNLNLPVKRGNHLINTAYASGKINPKFNLPGVSYTTAIGLALEALDQTNLFYNYGLS